MVNSATPAAPVTPGVPQISYVVVVYKMAQQALRTVQSLMADYQRGVSPDDFEVIVVENESDSMVDPNQMLALGPNIRYFPRAEIEPTPIHAANFGASKARAPMIGMVIDGARMMTPGVTSYILAARRFGPDTVVAVPGYHLGEVLQQEAAAQGYDEAAEAELLAGISWPDDGYRLFEISTQSGTSVRGPFLPMQESNCFAVPTHIWNDLGGYDTAFRGHGGGLCNLDLYYRVVEDPRTQLVTLPGEGTFHQFHGGATTGGTVEAERQSHLDDFIDEYIAIRGFRSRPPAKRTIFLGTVPESAQPFIKHSAEFTLRNNPQPHG